MKYRDAVICAGLAFCCCVISCAPQEENSDSGGTAAPGVDTVRAVPVRARVVQPEYVEEAIEVTGVIAPHRAVDVVAEAGGRLIRVPAAVGHRVTAGDTLAVIDDRVAASRLEHAEAQVLSARNQAEDRAAEFRERPSTPRLGGHFQAGVRDVPVCRQIRGSRTEIEPGGAEPRPEGN